MPASLAFSPVAFPLSRAARQKYAFETPSFSDFEAARVLSAQINATRDLENQPERAVKSGRLAAAALLDEIFAHVIAQYVEKVERDALQSAPAFLDSNLGEIETGAFFDAVQLHFLPPAPWNNRPEIVEHLLRLHLANQNPALQTFSEIFDNQPLFSAGYVSALQALSLYFQTLPAFGPKNQSLLDFLWEPILRHPDSVEDQLKWILVEWEDLVEPFFARLLTHLDLIREEEKPTFFGPGPARVLNYKSGAGAVGMEEYEAFTPDKDWMPGVVLIAKQTYVWLDQLSKKYSHTVQRLDQVPDEELDELAARGITGLWLIGLCQRSTASQKIKRITGNPDALASAYSLYSYEIAREIGGPEALENLKSRAMARGIRMASDMVPNHMAIDSQWMIERPDYFLSLPSQPFPNASFNGPDLCDDERVGIFLEDGYYSKTEASVVFKRVDYHSGETRFVYHGNDGTAIPWNDTAQLDYLKPDVREAVMQTILDVARQFPIIRFDAAMTLAKRHIHRLWFPAPGSGGDIPSRAGRGVSAEEFDALMPQEFWREVVERVGREVPETLLLAEAFWMMEGFFVRTLGMHRVYNSAFMNMLRDEKNAEYRQTLKNTLEFDPAILGRFVNFMNNPDEETAREQFGKGDKYFGVCTLLATLPGLPMIGHGQIEGYGEKYGMEYPRAYWNETPDAGFIKHHQTAIFPLLHKRHLFAGSENFTLYDFWNGDGFVDEDVYAYSNRAGQERALVVFNNRSSNASGWIKGSASVARKNLDGSKTLVQRELGEALGAQNDAIKWMIFCENTSGLEFLRASHELYQKGLFVELGAYGHQVFLGWREVSDESGLYARLAAMLQGRGVPNVERALKEMLLAPIHAPFRALCNAKLWAQLLDEDGAPSEVASTETKTEIAPVNTAAAIETAEVETAEVKIPQTQVALAPLDELEARFSTFVAAANRFVGGEADEAEIVRATREKIEIALESDLAVSFESQEKALLLAYSLVSEIGALSGTTGSAIESRAKRTQSARLVDEWLLDEMLSETLAAFIADSTRAVATLQIWLRQIPETAAVKAKVVTPFAFLTQLLADDDARQILGINTFERVIYFHGEGWEALKAQLQLGAAFEDAELPLEQLDEAAQTSEFRVVKWMENARPTAPQTQ
ncbi:Alpha amylase, catalytic domain [Abditibacterium utsteinense]|uniref:Alpha amylase, catalytic domain n=1 Tax=Abditibacterium utsteinense TaxID=1960156 RepID=A0A2S8SPW7_9BACT|nr:alpha-amylase family glycosyl hydrolase [Abditibacterium utsteinense]PQV62838.1 Alpha amylase, catalytic domain [Abditibacterium utsteinense]